MKNFNPVSTSMGRKGSLYIDDTAAHIGDFGVLQAVSATVATLVSANDELGDVVMEGTLTNVPIPAGVSIFGHWTSVTLSSGKVIAYKI